MARTGACRLARTDLFRAGIARSGAIVRDVRLPDEPGGYRALETTGETP